MTTCLYSKDLCAYIQDSFVDRMSTVIYVYIYDFRRKHARSLNGCSNIPAATTAMQLVTKCLKKRQVKLNVVEYIVIYLGKTGKLS